MRKWKIGIDEAGRGPLAGPVSVGVFAVEKKNEKKVRALFRGVKESKQLTEKAREEYFARLEDAQAKGLLRFAVGLSSAKMIDSKGIVFAIQKAMGDALAKIHVGSAGTVFETRKSSTEDFLVSKTSVLETDCSRSARPKEVLGTRKKPTDFFLCPAPVAPSKFPKTSFERADDFLVLLDGSLKAPPEYIHQKTIIKGDEKEWVIALASISAKVTRDRLMVQIAKKHANYGFEIHKGYGTALHHKNIVKYGFSGIHRKSFCKRYTTLDSKFKV